MSVRIRSRRTPRVAMLVAPVLAIAFLLNGCMLRRLEQNVERLETTALIGGHVTTPDGDGAPTIVVLTQGRPASIVDSFVLERPGAYFFVVFPGSYGIAAFVDRNHDFIYQPNEEPAAVTWTANALRQSWEHWLWASRTGPAPKPI